MHKTDHAAVVELFNAKTLTGKLARWSLTVQDFNPSFSHVPGALNHVADALSRYIGTIDDEYIDLYVAACRCHYTNLNDSISVAQREDTFCKPIIIDFTIYWRETGRGADSQGADFQKFKI